MRAPFFTASIAPVILGTAIAWSEFHVFDPLLFWLTLIGAVSAHAGANIINDYYDHLSGNDEANRNYNTFSGGSRMIQTGRLSPVMMLTASLIAFSLAIAIGLFLNWAAEGNVILWIGIIGILIGFFYSALPIGLSYRGIGETGIALAFGPLIVFGAWFVQTDRFSWLPILASVPVGIWVGLIIFINEFQDFDADSQTGKKTLVVIFHDKRKAIRFYQVFLVGSFIWIFGWILKGVFPVWTSFVFLLIPVVFWNIAVSSKKYDTIQELLPVNAATIGIHFLGTIILSLGFIL
ncbi:MAG: 1,4-dihydroxy-2-naphthoate octaprenyltransferase [Candidatus Neomarinimicrobiota bacterium]